jgi:hypothetical protein
VEVEERREKMRLTGEAKKSARRAKRRAELQLHTTGAENQGRGK